MEISLKGKETFGNGIDAFLASKYVDNCRLGTYGIVKNADGVKVGVYMDKNEAIVDFGYLFDKLIGFITKEGFGIWWLGCIFNISEFEGVDLLEGSDISPAITSLGFVDDKNTLVEASMRKLANSNNSMNGAKF